MLKTVEVGGGLLALLGFGLSKLGDASAIHAVGWVLLGIGVLVALSAGVLDLVMKLAGH